MWKLIKEFLISSIEMNKTQIKYLNFIIQKERIMLFEHTYFIKNKEQERQKYKSKLNTFLLDDEIIFLNAYNKHLNNIKEYESQS